MVQYIPGDSLFHRLDPRPKIIFTLLMTGIVLVVKNLWLAGFILLTMLGLWLAARLPVATLTGLAKALSSVIVFLFTVQALFYPGETVLVSPVIPSFVPIIGGLGRITLEGVLFAGMLILRLLAMMMALPLISLTTPIHILSLGMVRMGLSNRLAYTISTALNLIPVLQTEANVIVDAQRLRGFQVFETGRFFDKLRAYPSLITPLVIGAMRRAQLIAIAMDSRAFGASKHRTYVEDIQMQSRDWAFMLFILSYIALILILNFMVF